MNIYSVVVTDLAGTGYRTSLLITAANGELAEEAAWCHLALLRYNVETTAVEVVYAGSAT